MTLRPFAVLIPNCLHLLEEQSTKYYYHQLVAGVPAAIFIDNLYSQQSPGRSSAMMPKSRFSLKRSELEETRQASNQPPVKRVSIFISNLDSHIAESYQKLRRSKYKEGTQPRECFLSDQKSRFEETHYKDSSTMLQNMLKVITSAKKDVSLVDSLMREEMSEESSPALINNEEVREYVSLVYEMYNIPDPMQNLEETRRKIPIRASRRTLTDTPRVRRKSTASELKDRIVKHRDIDLTPFHSNYSSNCKQESGFDFSLITEKSKEKSKQYSSTGMKKSRNVDAIPETVRLSCQKLKKSGSIQGQAFTPQVFRYCFACEATVLEANLKHHERSCALLRQFADKSLEELISLLDQKIARISRSIQSQFVDADSDRFLSEFKDLKKSVEEWVHDVNSSTQPIARSLGQDQGRGNKQNLPSQSARRRMEQIQSSWGKCIGSRLEQMSKLHWFSRLRENVKLNYQV